MSNVNPKKMFKVIFLFWFLFILFDIAILAGIVYVVAHFVMKFW